MMQTNARFGALLAILGFLLLLPIGLNSGPAMAQSGTEPPLSQGSPSAGNVPGSALGNASDSEFWRALRHGGQANVSIPDRQAGTVIQSEGDNWRAIRNGPLYVYGGIVILGFLALVGLFFGVRGRIHIGAGTCGRTVERFNALERFTHWMTATSFIVLALTGLNLLFGRDTVLPVLTGILGEAGGKSFFGTLTIAGKYAHNYISFAFMLGILMMFVLWVRHNFPNRYDVIWLAKGGGLFGFGGHPPAKKFNAGQKLIFWAVILGGVSISMSGIALMFPFEFSMFAGTFELLNMFGVNLPTEFTPMAEMQLSQLWHSIVALVLIGIIIGHIYIGTLGMEGAFDAMGTGQVDENWAGEHHSVWLAELQGDRRPAGGGQGDALPGKLS